MSWIRRSSPNVQLELREPKTPGSRPIGNRPQDDILDDILPHICLVLFQGCGGPISND